MTDSNKNTSPVETGGTQGAHETTTPDSQLGVEDGSFDLADVAEQLGVDDIMGSGAEEQEEQSPEGSQKEPTPDNGTDESEDTRPQAADDEDEPGASDDDESTDDEETKPILDDDRDDAEDDGDDGDEEGDADEEDGEPENSKEKPAWFQKRIDKLTRQKKEAREKAEQLETELKETREKLQGMEHPVIPASPENPFSDTLDPKEVNQRVERAKSARAWLIDHPQGGEIEIDGETIEISPEQASRKRAELDELINNHAPARHDFLNKRQQAQQLAEQVYPTLLDKAHPHTKIAQSLVVDVPEILNIPDSTLVLGDFVTGALVRAGQYRLVKVDKGDSKKATDKKAAPEAEKPASTPPPSPTSTSPKRKAPAQDRDKVLQRATSTGDRDDVEHALEALVG